MAKASRLDQALDAWTDGDVAQAKRLAEEHLADHPDDEDALALLDDLALEEEAALAPPLPAGEPAAGTRGSGVAEDGAASPDEVARRAARRFD